MTVLRRGFMIGIGVTATLVATAIEAQSDDPNTGAEPKTTEAPESNADAMTLSGGEESTVFRTLTVTGEDRIRIEFDRPELRVELDARMAPGLDWGDPSDILVESSVDLVTPLRAEPFRNGSRYLPKPWVDRFREDGVARFRPELEGVARWRLVVADSRSETVKTFEGQGNPPPEIVWDGRSENGEPVPPGITCSYVLEAHDRAGNRRNFVGEGFALPAYCLNEGDARRLLFPGEELAGWRPTQNGRTEELPGILLEVVSWLNQAPPDEPVEVRASARSFDEAQQLAVGLVRELELRTLGDPARLRPVADVRPDAPEAAVVMVTAGVF